MNSWSWKPLYRYDSTISNNPAGFHSGRGITLGRDASNHKVFLDPDDLEGHAVVVGKTGTGKSTLLANICSEIYTKKLGNIILIDPHGSLSDQVISITGGDKLVYVSPESVDNGSDRVSVSFNAISFNGDDEIEAESVIGWIRDLFATEASFSQGTWGPRIELIFRGVLKELMLRKAGANLGDLARLLMNPKEMKNFLRGSSSPDFRSFIEIQMKDWKNWIQYSTSTINKILPVVTNASIKRLISARRDSFDLFSALSNGDRVVSVEVSKGLLSEEMSRMISTLFLLKVWNSILTGTRSKEIDFNTYIVIDEAQNIPSGILQKMLSEGRKYGLRLILSNQYIEQMNREYSKSVFGNVRNFISFSVSKDDAFALSGTIPDRDLSSDLFRALSGQRIHRAVIWNNTESGLSGPLSFIPAMLDPHFNPRDVRSAKIESIRKYGAVVQDDPEDELVPEQSLHEFLILSFMDYLDRKGINMDKESKIGNSIPDGSFYFNGNQYIIEVEVSDLLRKIRVMRKIKDYSGRKIIFLTDEGKSEKMFRMISQGNEFAVKDGLRMEVPLYEGSEKIYLRELGDFLSNIYLIEKRENDFCLYNGTKCSRFSTRDLSGKSSFIRAIASLENHEIRLHLYNAMVNSGTFYWRIGDIRSIELFNAEHLDRFLDPFIRKGIEYMTISDLLRNDI